MSTTIPFDTTTVCIGGRWRAGSSGQTLAQVEAMFVARQPMGRLGTTDEVAALAVYLASDESRFTTGTASMVDGGWSL